jgi:hypothetical protein
MKLIVFVHTCTQYEYSRGKLIEETWGDQSDIVFITDNPNSTLKNHIYIGPYEKGFTYHPMSLYKMFYYFIENYYDYDWFMIIDDDAYLYIEKLKQYLSFFNKDEPYMIGDFLNWIKYNPKYCNDYNAWVSGGPGIVFTRSSIIKFIDLMVSKEAREANHDKWLQNLFEESDKSIRRVDCPGFHQYGAQELLEKYSKDNNNIVSVHLERNMELLFEFHERNQVRKFPLLNPPFSN